MQLWIEDLIGYAISVSTETGLLRFIFLCGLVPTHCPDLQLTGGSSYCMGQDNERRFGRGEVISVAIDRQ